MEVRRLDKSELKGLRGRGGYVLNVGRSVARVHRAGCPLVGLMNPDKRGGVYLAPTFEEASAWLVARSMRVVPCRLCLSSLAYRPRPEKLTEKFDERGI